MKTHVIRFVLAAGCLGFSTVSSQAQCPAGQHIAVQVNAGSNDAFALPFETASPDAGTRGFLVDYFGNALRDFDEIRWDASLAHTLYWEPTEFCSAFLTLHILAGDGGGAESNDTISMEFNPDFVPGLISQWAWGLYIGSIVGHAWWVGNEETLVLDLLHLPPDPHNRTSVEWALADGNLDVVVDDDTAVDYITLLLCACDGPETATQPTTWGRVKALYR
jgi:hypothetical protein